MTKFTVELWSENPFDKRILLELIEHQRGGPDVLQQKLDGKDNAEDSSGFVPATDKQKVLMNKHRIPFDDGTSKDDATTLISNYFDSKKK